MNIEEFRNYLNSVEISPVKWELISETDRLQGKKAAVTQEESYNFSIYMLKDSMVREKTIFLYKNHLVDGILSIYEEGRTRNQSWTVDEFLNEFQDYEIIIKYDNSIERMETDLKYLGKAIVFNDMCLDVYIEIKKEGDFYITNRSLISQFQNSHSECIKEYNTTDKFDSIENLKKAVSNWIKNINPLNVVSRR